MGWIFKTSEGQYLSDDNHFYAVQDVFCLIKHFSLIFSIQLKIVSLDCILSIIRNPTRNTAVSLPVRLGFYHYKYNENLQKTKAVIEIFCRPRAACCRLSRQTTSDATLVTLRTLCEWS